MSFVTPIRIPSGHRLGIFNSASKAAVISSLRSSLFIRCRFFLVGYAHHRAATSGLRQFSDLALYFSVAGYPLVEQCSAKEILGSLLKSEDVSEGHLAQSGSSWSYQLGTDPRSSQAGEGSSPFPRLNPISTVQTFKPKIRRKS